MLGTGWECQEAWPGVPRVVLGACRRGRSAPVVLEDGNKGNGSVEAEFFKRGDEGRGLFSNRGGLCCRGLGSWAAAQG